MLFEIGKCDTDKERKVINKITEQFSSSIFFFHRETLLIFVL